MLKSFDNRTIALAGVLQAAHLVNRIAQHGMADQAALETSIGSVLKLDAESTREVYGGLNGVMTGYVISLLQLEGRLRARSDLLERVTDGVREAQALAANLPLTDPAVLAILADTYSDTVSTLSPRIMVTGEPNQLNRPEIANRIRALLLAGVRAGILWHQCGGGRLQLLFQARKTVARARELLKEVGNDRV
jgi:high frequency lysogenization protein